MIEQQHRDREDQKVQRNLVHLRKDAHFKKIVDDVRGWPWPLLSNHKSSSHPLHELVFLSETDMTIEELGIHGTIGSIIENVDENGIFQIPIKIGPGRGGTGDANLAWMLCDAPLLATSLVRLGLGDMKEIKEPIAKLVSLVKDNGWPCATSPSTGKFRGPGKKDDPCPYANMIMLKLLAELPEKRDGQAAKKGIESALTLWKESRVRHPYLFKMGTDFRKLKLPFVWYDILHLADVLSRFPSIQNDERMKEIIAVIESKGHTGRYTPESVYTAWNGWDFGQKMEPSRWMTFEVHNILERHYGSIPTSQI